MTKVTVKEWVDALRSGKYKQGKRALNRENEFCCLGVLCDLLEPDSWYTREREFGVKPEKYWNGHYLMPPSFVVDQLTEVLMSEVNVAVANDRDADFNEIAELIESKYPLDYVIKA